MFYNPKLDNHGLPHNPWIALITPRPIGWISTRSKSRIDNLAPYSFFNAISGKPPFVMMSSNPVKDTQHNIEDTGVFAVNIATYALRDAVNFSSADYPRETDEFSSCNIAKVECQTIDAPGVADSPIRLECIYNQTLSLKPSDGSECQSSVIIGEVVGIYIDDDILTDGKVDPRKYDPIGRMGYMDYVVAKETFEMFRPALKKP